MDYTSSSKPRLQLAKSKRRLIEHPNYAFLFSKFDCTAVTPNPLLERTAPALHVVSLCEGQCRRVCRSTKR